jgi:hypothetical protein
MSVLRLFAMPLVNAEFDSIGGVSRADDDISVFGDEDHF